MKTIFPILIIGFLFSACQTPPEPDKAILSSGSARSSNGFKITDTRVLQAIEGAQLIAKKNTVVRVMVAQTIGSSMPITGTLAILIDDVLQSSMSNILPVETISVVNSPSWGNENHTLNFEILAPIEIPISNNVKFKIVLKDTDSVLYDTYTTTAFKFVPPIRPKIFYVPIEFKGNRPPSQWIKPTVGDAFLKNVFPVDESDNTLYQKAPIDYEISFTGNNDNTVSFDEINNDIFLELSYVKEFLYFDGHGALNNTIVYGFLPDNPIPFNGLAARDDFYAVGNTDLKRYQRTLAHEVGHLYGLTHLSADLNNNLGWDVESTLFENPLGNDITNKKIKNINLFDFMKEGVLSKGAWINKKNFNYILTEALPSIRELPAKSLGDSTTQFSRIQLELESEVAVIQGVLDESGRRITKLDPVFRYPWKTEPSNVKEGRYIALVKTDSGKEYQGRFTGEIKNDLQDEKSVYGFFKVRIAVPPRERIISLVILDSFNDNRSIAVVKQQGRLNLLDFELEKRIGVSPDYTLNWKNKVEGLIEKTNSRFHLVYSQNGETNWQPVEFGINGRLEKYPISAKRLFAFDRTQKGRFGVFVSDGLNTTFRPVELVEAE